MKNTRCLMTVAAGIWFTMSACSSPKDANSGGDSVAGAKAGSLEGPTHGDSASNTAFAAHGAGGVAGTNSPGMMKEMMTAAAMDSMQMQLRMMDTLSVAQVKAMVPVHAQLVANMLSQMSIDMRSMGMASNANWTAIADSIRQDLARMPEMSAAKVKAMIVSHHARVLRLMDMHRQMMGKIGK